MDAMDKNLDIITYAVSLIAKTVIMASGFSGRARKRSLKRLAKMDAGTKEKELLFLRDKVRLSRQDRTTLASTLRAETTSE